mmetsp:Transcript_7834/g.23067  ORF Transcript_7834/g.23067 Transcript_7834/m.23067 type:complete len:239 (-) Transcript_7834:1230-1946(-)
MWTDWAAYTASAEYKASNSPELASSVAMSCSVNSDSSMSSCMTSSHFSDMREKSFDAAQHVSRSWRKPSRECICFERSMEKMRQTDMRRASDFFESRSRMVRSWTDAKENTSSHSEVVRSPSAVWFLAWSAAYPFWSHSSVCVLVRTRNSSWARRWTSHSMLFTHARESVADSMFTSFLFPENRSGRVSKYVFLACMSEIKGKLSSIVSRKNSTHATTSSNCVTVSPGKAFPSGPPIC